MKVAIGADHAGYEVKERLKARLARAGHEVVDLGTSSPEPCDYPEPACKVAITMTGPKLARVTCGRRSA